MNFPVRDHMLVDPALQQAIMRRITAANICVNQPPHAADPLGLLQMPGGKEVSVYLRHAVDAVLLDDVGKVVLITRRNPPGMELAALPGGFIDLRHGSTSMLEHPAEAALREAREETGIGEDILAAANVKPVGARACNRPFDIREAWDDIVGTPIKQGDLFAVSTQAFCVWIKGDLSNITLQAGDDASKVRVEEVAALQTEQFAVPDHLAMIRQAVASIPRRREL
jgi:8-oxo-dGTP pyrophosphatase MutT (NUDIX family)